MSHLQKDVFDQTSHTQVLQQPTLKKDPYINWFTKYCLPRITWSTLSAKRYISQNSPPLTFSKCSTFKLYSLNTYYSFIHKSVIKVENLFLASNVSIEPVKLSIYSWYISDNYVKRTVRFTVVNFFIRSRFGTIHL